MKCPVCKAPLIVVERNEIELDFCHQCKGFWFDEGEINCLSELHGLDFSLPDLNHLPIVPKSQKTRPCPRCHKKMIKTCLDIESKLIIDRCPKGDGLWFDAGELSQTIQKFTKETNTGTEKMVSFLGEVFKT